MATCGRCYSEKPGGKLNLRGVDVQVCRGCQIDVERTLGFLRYHGLDVARLAFDHARDGAENGSGAIAASDEAGDRVAVEHLGGDGMGNADAPVTAPTPQPPKRRKMDVQRRKSGQG